MAQMFRTGGSKRWEGGKFGKNSPQPFLTLRMCEIARSKQLYPAQVFITVSHIIMFGTMRYKHHHLPNRMCQTFICVERTVPRILMFGTIRSKHLPNNTRNVWNASFHTFPSRMFETIRSKHMCPAQMYRTVGSKHQDAGGLRNESFLTFPSPPNVWNNPF